MNRGVYLLVIHGTTPIVHRRHDSPALADVTVARRRARSSRLVSSRFVSFVSFVSSLSSRARRVARRGGSSRDCRATALTRARETWSRSARSPTSMMIRELAAEVLATPDGGEARKTRARESDEDARASRRPDRWAAAAGTEDDGASRTFERRLATLETEAETIGMNLAREEDEAMEMTAATYSRERDDADWRRRDRRRGERGMRVCARRCEGRSERSRV